MFILQFLNYDTASNTNSHVHQLKNPDLLRRAPRSNPRSEVWRLSELSGFYGYDGVFPTIAGVFNDMTCTLDYSPHNCHETLGR